MNYKDPMNAPAAEFALELAPDGLYYPSRTVRMILMSA